jgi:hypothetical protein
VWSPIQRAWSALDMNASPAYSKCETVISSTEILMIQSRSSWRTSWRAASVIDPVNDG